MPSWICTPSTTATSSLRWPGRETAGFSAPTARARQRPLRQLLYLAPAAHRSAAAVAVAVVVRCRPGGAVQRQWRQRLLRTASVGLSGHRHDGHGGSGAAVAPFSGALGPVALRG